MKLIYNLKIGILEIVKFRRVYMHLFNSLKNSIYGIASQLIIVLLMFVSRKIFVDILPVEYLGLNGLFSNVISVLSLTELGFGTAAIYALYRPIAMKDYKKQAVLMRVYAKIYHVMFFVVLILGLCLMPFIPYLIKDLPQIPNLYFIYYLFVINSAITYLFAYKRSLLFADQKNYRIVKANVLCKILCTLLQIIILKVTGNYILFLIIMIGTSFLENWIIARIVDKEYEYLKDYKDEHLDVETKQELIKNTKALLMHKIGAIAVFQTDNLITSTFVGIVATGLLSNYTMILNQVRMIITTIIDGAKASIGNYSATESDENKLIVFRKLNYINHIINSTCTTGLFILLNFFIAKLWLKNENLLLPQTVVLLLCIEFYLRGMRYSYNIFKETSGVYHPDRYKAIVEAILNLVISIILVNYIGIAGVILGTIITTICIPYVVEVYVTFKYVFHKGPMVYYKIFSRDVIATTTMVILSTILCANITVDNSLLQFFIMGIIAAIVSIVINILFYINTIEYRFCIGLFCKIFRLKRDK